MVDYETKEHHTALIEAASLGLVDSIGRLVAHGAHPDYEATDGKTALMYACEGGQTEAIAALVANGARVNFENKNGQTAFLMAMLVVGGRLRPCSAVALRLFLSLCLYSLLFYYCYLIFIFVADCLVGGILGGSTDALSVKFLTWYSVALPAPPHHFEN